MSGRRITRAEPPGALEDDVDAELVPGQVRGIALVQDGQLVTVDAEQVVRELDVCREPSVDGVAPQKLSELCTVGEIVDRDELGVRAAFMGSAEGGSANSSEAVDGHSYRHGFLLRSRSRQPAITPAAGPSGESAARGGRHPAGTAGTHVS